MIDAPTVYANVVGAHFRGKEAVRLYRDLHQGQGVMLQRDPGNPVDHNAVTVLDPDYEQHIGFIERAKAAVLAKWMDEGWLYLANVITPVSKGCKYVRVKCTPVDKPKVVATTKVTEKA